MKTIGDLAAYSIRQGADLANCNARKDAIVEIIDAFTVETAPKAWWRFGR